MNKNTIEETLVNHVEPFSKIFIEGNMKPLSPVKEQKTKMKKSLNKEYCPFCNRLTVMIWVHSHYQCQNCKNVVLSCCGDR